MPTGKKPKGKGPKSKGLKGKGPRSKGPKSKGPKSKGPKGKAWIVTTSGDRPMADIAKDLTRAGLTVDQVNDQISSISGTGDSRLKSKLKSVKGVVDVAPDTPIDIGPPGSSDTW